MGTRGVAAIATVAELRAYLWTNGGAIIAIIARSEHQALAYARWSRIQGKYLGEDRRTPEQRWESQTLALPVPDGWRAV